MSTSTQLVEKLKSVLDSLKAIDPASLCQKFDFNFDVISGERRVDLIGIIDEINSKSKRVFQHLTLDSNLTDRQRQLASQVVAEYEEQLVNREGITFSELINESDLIVRKLDRLLASLEEIKGTTI